MVTTRASTRASSLEPDYPPSQKSSPSSSPTKSRRTTTATTKRAQASSPASSVAVWSHAPTTLTLLWMAISLPLVAWDTCYVLGRPHTMFGGKWHQPFWSPYKLYGEIDYVYGFKAFDGGEGFTAAQASLNVVETLMYLVYVGLWYFHGSTTIATTQPGVAKQVRRRLSGSVAALCVLVGFSAAVMTFSKTVLYGAHEHFSGWVNVGHNSVQDLVLLWILPNGSWIVFSAYMIVSLGREILDGLTIAGSIKTKIV